MQQATRPGGPLQEPSEKKLMALNRCPHCRGFVPAQARACPNCSAPSAAPGLLSRAALASGLLGGGVIAFTLMACYGMPPCADGSSSCYALPISEDAGSDAGGDAAMPNDDGGEDAGPDAALLNDDAAADASDASTSDASDANAPDARASDSGDTDASLDAGDAGD
jgi:hypothetical protein